MLRGVLGTASWRAQQVSPQFAADVSLLLSATAHLGVQDLLDAKKLVRDSPITSIHSMRLRGISWYLLRGPMRAIVPDIKVLGQEVM